MHAMEALMKQLYFSNRLGMYSRAYIKAVPGRFLVLRRGTAAASVAALASSFTGLLFGVLMACTEVAQNKIAERITTKQKKSTKKTKKVRLFMHAFSQRFIHLSTHACRARAVDKRDLALSSGSGSLIALSSKVLTLAKTSKCA